MDVAIASMGSLAVMDGVHTEGQGRGRMEGTYLPWSTVCCAHSMNMEIESIFASSEEHESPWARPNGPPYHVMAIS